jgi:two-component system, cell cycle sensor histidine kinase and response regulator CckA
MILPDHMDENLPRAGRKLRIFLWATSIACMVVALAFFCINPQKARTYLIHLGYLELVCLGMLLITDRGRSRHAAWLFIAFLWLYFFLVSIFSGGIRAQSFTGTLVLIVMAGACWGARQAAALMVLNALAGLFLVYAERARLLPMRTISHSSFDVWLMILFFSLLLFVLVELGSADIRRALRQAREGLTGCHRAEEALRYAEQSRTELMNNVDGIVWEADALTFQFKFVSHQAERLLGYPVQQWLTEPDFWASHIHPEDRDWVVNLCRRRTQEGLRQDFEYRMVAADGRTVWLRDIVSVVATSEHAARLRGLMVDISEHKHVADALRNSEEHFRSLIENAQDLITNIGADGVIRFQSPSCLPTMGYTPEQLVNRNAFDFIEPADAPKVIAALARAIGEPTQAVIVEFRFRHADGSWRTLESIGKRLMKAEPPLVVVNSRDVTERRRLEEQFRQSQKMEAIGQLAGGVAHDFNNILSVMMMQAELAGSYKNLPREVHDLLNEITVSAERAANLTRQLLAFSRRQVLQPRLLDLNEIVTSLAKMLQRILGEDVRMQLNLHPAPLILHADAGMLDQVLMNLAVNARDAMPKGGQLILETAERVISEEEARSIPETLPGLHACLRVSDAGCGISSKNLPHIFEPFFTTKEPGRGTGLGLATVFGIVKQHRGSIKVYSEPSQGTTFQILLPISAPSKEALARETAKPKPRGGTETILVAEDETAVRMLTRMVLERHGYQVIDAANGVEALRIWNEHPSPIHLLLTDMVMPEGVSGRELAAKLQERNPSLKIILASGYSAELVAPDFKLQPGQNFLQKPWSPQQLLEAVRRSLDS